MVEKNISLSNRSVFGLQGSESSSFLQGIITQDINLLDKQGSIYTGLLSPQGKILFDFFIHKHDDLYLIECDQSQSDALMMRLNMYKLHADISFTDMSSEYSVVTNIGESEGKGMPDPRYAELGMRKIVVKSDIGNDTSPESDYHIYRLKLGIADSAEIGSGQYFPHECNFDQLNGLSFTKGCFVGQEVVSRMEHRGTARNRMVPFSSQAETFESIEPVTCGDTKLGTVISYREGYGIALIRLDRLERSATLNTDILAGSSAITFFKPNWAKFDLPQNMDES